MRCHVNLCAVSSPGTPEVESNWKVLRILFDFSLSLSPPPGRATNLSQTCKRPLKCPPQCPSFGVPHAWVRWKVTSELGTSPLKPEAIDTINESEEGESYPGYLLSSCRL